MSFNYAGLYPSIMNNRSYALASLTREEIDRIGLELRALEEKNRVDFPVVQVFRDHGCPVRFGGAPSVVQVFRGCVEHEGPFSVRFEFGSTEENFESADPRKW